MEQKPYLSAEAIANELDMDIQTIRRFIREKKLPAYRVGKEYRILREDFEKFMEQRRTVPRELTEV